MNVLYVKTYQQLSVLVKQQIGKVANSSSGPISIGIPGGRSAEAVIAGLLAADDAVLARVRLYLVDERMSGDTNEEALLKAGLEKAFTSGRMRSSQLRVPTTTSKVVPQLSLLYLGVGEDGHVASLFPGSYPALDTAEAGHVATIQNSPKPPLVRVTFTYYGL